MNGHTCAPPIGPGTPDAWTCTDCGQAWERHADPGGWRWPGEERVVVVCPYCRLEGFWLWPPDDEEDLVGNHFTAPKGHTVTPMGGVRMDVCPVQTPASQLYDPRPPWRSVQWAPEGTTP